MDVTSRRSSRRVPTRILETPLGAEGATVTVVEDFVRHLPHLAELEAKLRDTTSGALGDHLVHVDEEVRAAAGF